MLRVSNKSAFPPPPLPPPLPQTDITEALLYTIHNAVESRDVGSKCPTIQCAILWIAACLGVVQSSFFVLRHQFICISLIFERSHSLVRLLLQDRKRRRCHLILLLLLLRASQLELLRFGWCAATVTHRQSAAAAAAASLYTRELSRITGSRREGCIALCIAVGCLDVSN